jgi:hypothetical protein
MRKPRAMRVNDCRLKIQMKFSKFYQKMMVSSVVGDEGGNNGNAGNRAKAYKFDQIFS